MPFKPGDENINRAGRPRGRQNKATDELRSMVYKFLELNFTEVEAEFRRLDGKDKLNFIDKMLRHVLPPPQDELLRLSEKDLDRLIERLKARALDNCWYKTDITN